MNNEATLSQIMVLECSDAAQQALAEIKEQRDSSKECVMGLGSQTQLTGAPLLVDTVVEHASA